jgi:hypothetical protein
MLVNARIVRRGTFRSLLPMADRLKADDGNGLPRSGRTAERVPYAARKQKDRGNLAK